MANDRLRDALMEAGLTPAALADKLGVSPKTAERWVTSARAPFPRFRHQIAALVHQSEAYLWPAALSAQRQAEISESEVLRIYPYRASVPAELWARLFESATEEIGILVYSGFFLPEQHAPQLALLPAKAAAGVRVRILLGDPDCAQVAARGPEEEIGEAMASKIRNVLTAYYRPYSQVPGISIRLHCTTLYNSIFEFDDEMLVNTHAYGVPAAFAPTLHLRRLSSGTLFQTYASSFNRVWDQTATAWPPREDAA
jgi:transcriptional regulator with XRE-family HTH domain